MNFADFISKLSHRLANYPLPGHEEIVKKMSPNRMRLKGEPNESTRRSGVLLLFYPKGEVIYLPLILRPQYDGVHGGQMAFPGGRAELKDKNIQATALREAQEEIGIKASDVKIIGNLTELYINPSNLLCQPVMGYINYKPDFYPDEREVEDILEVPLSDFINPDTVQNRFVEARGYKFETPGFIIQEQIVWGATAMMIAELIEIMKDIK
ncbi:CoA pyrophosphatase [Emticicia sp. BO119]|uniref:NUDIX hydrolase n=1 Tax=Emticicia sp. BO119 TaxID=2757768 RepID=UPI0015F0D848|nr:CoA pyrophosphatase [Emticicia sp. BO119]MBA4852572.1 CoA pyrophosphatase [Emticicia sp. BO119]